MLFNIAESFSDELLAKARKVSVEAIGLPTRTFNLVKSQGIQNSLDAIYFVFSSLAEKPGIGIKTISDSQSAVHNFIKVLKETSIDKIIDSREEYFSSVDINVAYIFPDIVEMYLQKRSKKNYHRNKDIIEKRLNLNGDKIYSLESIASNYNLTKEGVRQIQCKIIGEIGLLLKGKLNTKTWKVSDNLVAGYKQIYSQLESLGTVISMPALSSIFPNLNHGYLDLFMEVSGYEKIPNNIERFRGSAKLGWYRCDLYKKKEIKSIFLALDTVFSSVEPVSITDITACAKNKIKKPVTNEVIKALLELINEVEINEQSVQIKFNMLSNTNKAFRVLHYYNKPLHSSKVARQINLLRDKETKYKVVRVNNLVNQMTTDTRFKPIGKSGNWALSHWDNVSNITIIEAIQLVFHQIGKPMKFNDLWESVKRLRPDASKNSLRAYLHGSPFFDRVGTGNFALHEWNLPSSPARKKRKMISDIEFNNAARAILVAQCPIDLPDLISLMAKKINLAETSVRLCLLSTSGLEIRPAKGKRCKEVFCTDIHTVKLHPKEQKITLRDKVQQEIRAILHSNPDAPVRKGDLYNKVVRKVACLRQTFYKYLSSMEDLRQYKEGSNYYAILSI